MSELLRTIFFEKHNHLSGGLIFKGRDTLPRMVMPIAVLMADLIRNQIPVKEDETGFREKFVDMQYCFKPENLDMLSTSVFDRFQ